MCEAMDETPRPAGMILFLNALALGVVAPLLYYIIVVPDAIWIGRLFVVFSLGRILGGPLLRTLQQNLGMKQTLVLSQLVASLSYALLCTAGHFQPSPDSVFGVVLLSCFFIALTAGNFPSVRLIFQPAIPEAGTAMPGLITMLGFAVGCALAILGNTTRVPDNSSIFPGGGLHRSAEYAAAVSCIALVAALRWHAPAKGLDGNWLRFPRVTSRSAIAMLTTLLCEAAFGMTVCVAPLMQWETYHFSPAKAAIVLGGAALISQSVRSVVQSRVQAQSTAPLILMIMGMLFSMLGFAGFTVSLWLSWLSHPVDGMKVGYWLVWFSGIPAAAGHGLLRAALPSILTLSGKPSRYPHAAVRFDQLATIVSGVFALYASSIWLARERSSFAIPCVVMALALPLGVFSWVIRPRSAEPIPQAEECPR